MKMKTLLSYPYAYILLLGAMLTAGAAAGQEQDNWRMGASVGYMSYYGDVSPYYIGRWADWGKFARFFEYNRHYITEASYGISLERKLTPTTGVLVQLDHGKFGMSDRYQRVSGGKDRQAPHWARALNFQTSVLDLGGGLTFRSDNGRFLRENAFLAPYAYLGAGLTRFTVKGDLYDANGNPYNYADPDVQPDGVYETNLRSMRTETEYPRLTGYADLGVGLTFHLGTRVGLSVETDMRYAFTDHLDDVHGKYKTAYPTGPEAYAAHPGTNVIDPITRKRGNDDGVNDMVFFQKLTFQYSFGRGRKPRFSAPFVYEPGLALPAVPVKRRAPQDTLPPHSDSLSDLAIWDSTAWRTKAPDLRMMREMQDLKNQFRAYRFSGIDQQYLLQEIEIRRQLSAVSAVRDSLREHGGNLGSGGVPADPYDRQIDSLQRRLSAIRQARALLREEVAYSPIVTEYPDSTKIMIYKPRMTDSDRHFMPLIGSGDDRAPRDAFRLNAERLPVPSGLAPSGSSSQTFLHPDGRDSTADSLRSRLDMEIQTAGKKGDTFYMQQLYQLRRRVDSLREPPASDSIYILNQAKIREDSLRLIELLEDEPVSRPGADTMRRNFIQRFLDRFRRKEVGSTPAVPLGYSESPHPHDRAPRGISPYLSDYSGQTFADQSQQIASIREDIAQLRRQNEAYRRNPPQPLYLQGSGRVNRREARRDRKALYALGRSIERSNRDRRYPAVSPQIVLSGPARSEDQELKEIRTQLTALQNAQTVKNDSQAAMLHSQLDSVHAPQKTTASTAAPAQIWPLEKRIDSLNAELAALRRAAKDTASVPPTPVKARFIIENYPVVSTYFTTGSARLSPSEQEKLRPVAEMAKTRPETRLLIQGYTDGTGSPAVNKALAEKRCETVRNILMNSYQIPETNILSSPQVPQAHSGRNPLLRRVDVRIKSVR